jgi:hypothetical protein
MGFSTSNVSNAARLSSSTRCVTVENSISASNICKNLDVFNEHIISLEDTVSFA